MGIKGLAVGVESGQIKPFMLIYGEFSAPITRRKAPPLSIFVFRSNQEVIDWIAVQFSHYMGLKEFLENPESVRDVVGLVVSPDVEDIELRQVPHEADLLWIERAPLISSYRRTGDEQADFDHILVLLQEAKANAASVHSDPQSE